MIQLNKQGYEPFIDYLKGLSIICVLFLHTIPKLEYLGVCLWASMAVPCFLLIQAFHVFKKDANKIESPKFSKLFKRILLPYFIIQVFAIILQYNTGEYTSVMHLVKSVVVSGGLGPGSYYPWIYLQMAVALPLFVKLFGVCNVMKASIIRKSGG